MTDGWSPIVEKRTDLVTASAAVALHGLLDAPGPPPRAGDRLPPLWHWLAFRPDSPQRELGIDGHPNLGLFMPPTGLPRRMFAGGQVEFRRPLFIGAALRRTSVVTNVSKKTGRTGHLVFVEVSNRIGVDDEPPAVIETNHIVYREAAGAPTEADCAASSGVIPSPQEAWEWQLNLGTEATLLFRFSALTYNAHRIHYDREYATEIEGYPGLVVQGPIQAIALAELARRHHPTQSIRTFSFRAIRPAFDGHPLRLRGHLTSNGTGELLAIDGYGRHTMQAEVSFGLLP